MGEVGSLGARTDAKLGQDVGDVGAGRGSADESASAISGLERPETRRRSTSSSRGVNPTLAATESRLWESTGLAAAASARLPRRRCPRMGAPARILSSDEPGIAQGRPCSSLGTLVDRPLRQGEDKPGRSPNARAALNSRAADSACPHRIARVATPANHSAIPPGPATARRSARLSSYRATARAASPAGSRPDRVRRGSWRCPRGRPAGGATPAIPTIASPPDQISLSQSDQR